MTEEGSRNMFEGMFCVHEKEESKPKAKEKANNKKKEKITKNGQKSLENFKKIIFKN